MSRFRGLWQASVNATKRALTWNLEDLVPPNEKYIFNFSSAEELKRWHLYSDSEYGAYNGDIHDLWEKEDSVLMDRFLEIIEKKTEDET